MYAGRTTTGTDFPQVAGDDVLIADERLLATTVIMADGYAAFPPLAVATEGWTSNSLAIPAELLCGTTVVAARVYRAPDGAELLDATWFVISAVCQ